MKITSATFGSGYCPVAARCSLNRCLRCHTEVRRVSMLDKSLMTSMPLKRWSTGFLRVDYNRARC